MDEEALVQTRRSLHGVAELLLAGPQYRACGDIRLRARPGGFGTVAAGFDLRVSGTFLLAGSVGVPAAASEPPAGAVGVPSSGPGSVRVPLCGTFADVAAAAGVDPSTLDDVYHDGSGLLPSDEIVVDDDAAQVLARAFELGDAALHAFAPEAEIVLWPEHFDIAITVDEVNYGVSPGDSYHATPYAYVGPPTVPAASDFWNAPFGAARPLSSLPDADAITAFFHQGRSRL
jgi:hypothetical protein